MLIYSVFLIEEGNEGNTSTDFFTSKRKARDFVDCNFTFQGTTDSHNAVYRIDSDSELDGYNASMMKNRNIKNVVVKILPELLH